jgi:hypothetical protein
MKGTIPIDKMMNTDYNLFEEIKPTLFLRKP